MKLIESKKRVLLSFEDAETEIFISDVAIRQISSQENMLVQLTVFAKKDEKYHPIKSFSDNYSREKVNSLTTQLIKDNPNLGLFDLNEILMLKVAIEIIDSEKTSNKYLGLTKEDLQIIEQ